MPLFHKLNAEADARMCSIKKLLLKYTEIYIFQNLQENTFAGVFFRVALIMPNGLKKDEALLKKVSLGNVAVYM